MNSDNVIEAELEQRGFTKYRWINPADIVVKQWVRVKCEFGCSDYGLGACPPNTPLVSECKTFFSEYTKGIIIQLTVAADKNNYPKEWSQNSTKNLLELERKVFLLNYPKTFLLNQTCCCSCKECSGKRLTCSDKKNARPSPEAFAVDVYQTLKNNDIELNVVTENPSVINRTAILLIE